MSVPVRRRIRSGSVSSALGFEPLDVSLAERLFECAVAKEETRVAVAPLVFIGVPGTSLISVRQLAAIVERHSERAEPAIECRR